MSASSAQVPPLPSPVAVTGAGGYLASWIVKMCLDEGLEVHATVRDLAQREKFAHLERLAADSPGTLKLFAADLLQPDGFGPAFEGTKVVFHVASPFIQRGIRDPRTQLLTPAVQGTEGVLAAVEGAKSVRKVVLTSSVAAVYCDASEAAQTPTGKLSEANWADRSSLTRQPYNYSKLQAERAAWRLYEAQARTPEGTPRWEMVTINPCVIFGPALSARRDSTSMQVLKMMVDGTMLFGAPRFAFGCVDVRDVAFAHLQAARLPTVSGRHLVCKEVLWMAEIARILRNCPQRGPFVPKGTLPDFAVFLAGPLLGYSRDFLRANLGHRPDFDTDKATRSLGIRYRPLEETLCEHLAQMRADGLA